MVQHAVDREVEQHGGTNADQTGQQADNAGFRVEYVRHIAFGCAHGAQNTDFLGTFQHGNIGDNADHDRRDHQ